MANPPITIGELVDVPAPGSAISSPWAQEVTNRIVHRFATVAAMNAWAAADGSLAYVTATTSLYVRRGSVWQQTPGSAARARVIGVTSQSIANNTTAARQYNSESYDTVGMHDNATNNSRLTVPAGYAGVWTVGYQVQYALFGGGSRGCWLAINGVDTERYAWQQIEVNVSGVAIQSTTHGESDMVLAVGDYVETRCFQASGGAMNLGVAGFDRMWAHYRGPVLI